MRNAFFVRARVDRGKRIGWKENGKCMWVRDPRGLTGFPAKKIDSRSTLVEGEDSRRWRRARGYSRQFLANWSATILTFLSDTTRVLSSTQCTRARVKMRCHRAVVSPCLSSGYAKNNDDDRNGARKFRQTKDNRRPELARSSRRDRRGEKKTKDM